MKRQILKIAKNFGCEISNYKSYKSDMGCQCFDFTVHYSGEQFNFDYGYYYGGGKNELLDKFSEFLKELDMAYNQPCYASPIL